MTYTTFLEKVRIATAELEAGRRTVALRLLKEALGNAPETDPSPAAHFREALTDLAASLERDNREPDKVLIHAQSARRKARARPEFVGRANL